MPKQEGTGGENQLDQAGEPTEEAGGKKPEQVEEMPRQEGAAGETNLIRQENQRKKLEKESRADRRNK